MSQGEIRIRERETGFGRQQFIDYEPPAHLRPHVISHQGYSERIERLIRRKALPHRAAVFVVNFGDPVTVIDPHTPSRTRTHPSTFIAGLHDQYVVLEQQGLSQGIQVNLTPIGARLFLGVSMHELANSGAHLEDILGPGARDLTERLRDAPDWPSRFAMLDDALTGRITSAELNEGIAWAWRVVDGTRGRAQIAAIADRLGVSHRHLIAEFREHVGLPPRTVGRIARFAGAVRLLQSGSARRWADIAIESGYYDQAHLVRDFRQFAGATPTEYERELREVERTTAS